MQEYLQNEPNETPGQQILMTEEASKNGALCLDGTVPDFYYRPGFGNGINKFNFYLQGGGWCANIDQCVQRTATDLGSSKFDQPYLNVGAVPYLSSNRTVNPLTYNWNVIYIRYCDGSSYSSDNQTLFKYNATVTLHFRGWRNVNGVLNTLLDKYNLSDATDVILSGCSAGALGVFFHADYFYQRILEFKDNKPFNYMSMPDAGYFMEVSHYQGMMEFNYAYGNLTIGLNQNCVASYRKNNLDITECMYALNIAPFVETKMFSIQSQYDSNQIKNMGPNQNNTVLINQYGQNLTYWYIDRYINTSLKHNGWLVSCYHHCTNENVWNDIIINGYTVAEAQSDVYTGKATTNFWFQNKTYPCNTCC